MKNRKPIRRALEVVLFLVLWVPIVVTGIRNFQESQGSSFAEKSSGWGLWLVGIFIWYVLVGGIGRFVLKKFGLLGSEH